MPGPQRDCVSRLKHLEDDRVLTCAYLTPVQVLAAAAAAAGRVVRMHSFRQELRIAPGTNCEVKFEEVIVSGFGKNKKEAKAAAASHAYNRFFELQIPQAKLVFDDPGARVIPDTQMLFDAPARSSRSHAAGLER